MGCRDMTRIDLGIWTAGTNGELFLRLIPKFLIVFSHFVTVFNSQIPGRNI